MIGFTRIAEYLKKFEKIGQSHKSIQQGFVRYVQKTTGILLLEREIEIQNATLFIKTDPATKNEIFYQKNKLQGFFKENTNTGLREISFK